MTFDDIRALALALPGVEESTSYGTPAFKAGKKLLCRLKEDGSSLAIRVATLDDKEMLLEAEPEALFITPHYDGYAYVLARLAKTPPALARSLLAGAWRAVAPAKIRKAAEAAGTAP